MKLSSSTLDILAEMICGGSGSSGGYHWVNFPYRSSSYLTKFFQRCDLDFTHDGTTRQVWVLSVLSEINELPAENPSLPSSELVRVLQQLADPFEFKRADKDSASAIVEINDVLKRDGLQLVTRNQQIIIENLKTQVTTSSPNFRLPTRAEEERRTAFERFLQYASEDEFTEQILVKLFAALGFQQIQVTGHQDRSMEFGKDMWMTFRLPTNHLLYIGVQVKKGRIHASGSDVSGNISGILAQLLMLMTYPVFDTKTNSNHLFDHAFLVTSGEITKQARALLSEFLDKTMRRNIMFMDRDDILDLCIKHSLPLPGEEPTVPLDIDFDNLPF